jgi:hypothetical protein
MELLYSVETCKVVMAIHVSQLQSIYESCQGSDVSCKLPVATEKRPLALANIYI